MKGPKNGILKASVRETSLEYRKIFYQSSSMLLVSVGQSYHEGDKLKATIDFINDRFKSCTIMLCDTLQRYNLIRHKINAYEAALDYGSEWLTRNKIIYSNLQIPNNIIRWDDILSHKDYFAKLKQIKDKYNSDAYYKKAFVNTIEDYIGRVLKRGEVFDINESYERCLSYLQEECAGMLIWADNGYSFEVYPNKRAEVLAVTYELMIKPVCPDVLIPVWLRFKRYSRKTGLESMLKNTLERNSFS